MAGDEQRKPTTEHPQTKATKQQWYLVRNGRRVGPISSKQLQQIAKSKQMTPQDLVWREGYADWIAAGRVKGLFVEPPVDLPIADSIPADQTPVIAVPVATSAAASTPFWYYRKGESVFGPIPEDDLKAMQAAGSLGPGDLVCRENTQQWMAVASSGPAKSTMPSGAISAPLISTGNPIQHPPRAREHRDQFEPGDQPGLISSMIVGSFVLGGPSILLNLLPLYQYLLMSRVVAQVIPGNPLVQGVHAGVAPQMLMHTAYILFGLVAVIAGFGLILEKHWGWVAGLLAAGFAFALGLYEGRIFVGALQVYLATENIPVGRYVTISMEISLAMMGMITIGFIGYSVLAFYALLRKRAIRFYRAGTAQASAQ